MLAGDRPGRTSPENALKIKMDEQYVLISYEDGATLAYTSPFKIAAELRRLVGEVVAAKPTAAGKLLVTTRSNKQTEELLKQSLFLERSLQFPRP